MDDMHNMRHGLGAAEYHHAGPDEVEEKISICEIGSSMPQYCSFSQGFELSEEPVFHPIGDCRAGLTMVIADDFCDIAQGFAGEDAAGHDL